MGFDVGTRRADFVVDEKVIVEIKAVTNLEDVHLAQAKSYVVAYDFARGLLINFGAKSLQYFRLYLILPYNHCKGTHQNAWRYGPVSLR